MRRNGKMEKAAKFISRISSEVDRLNVQVSAIESVIYKGGKVAEKQVLNLTELLMNELLKLDGIVADGDVKLQRRLQVKRVQKCVETHDVLKIKNSSHTGSDGTKISDNTQQHNTIQTSTTIKAYHWPFAFTNAAGGSKTLTISLGCHNNSMGDL